MENEMIRAFIAIELPEIIRAELAKLVEELKGNNYSFVKWVNPQGIHLTLKFLGNVTTDMLAPIAEAIKDECARARKFYLEITNLGVFPNIHKPRVVWVGIEGSLNELNNLQKLIDSRLAKLGFASEKRPFSPHITLARVNERSDSKDILDFAEIVSKLKYEKRLKISVDMVSLMRSQLLPTGAVYTRLNEMKLID